MQRLVATRSDFVRTHGRESLMQAIAVLRFLAVIGGFLTLSPFSLAIAASQIRESNTGLCVYDDKSYSEGAYLCIERSLILSCELAEGRLVWKVVKERDAGGFCQKRGATASNYHPPPSVVRSFIERLLTRQQLPSAFTSTRKHTVSNRSPGQLSCMAIDCAVMP